ncbi:MAG: transporter substrate-binding domain-containing protein [Colwellia sp.]|nr:transporter substrate-binding domain-containing protein [Colwellia sp.]
MVQDRLKPFVFLMFFTYQCGATSFDELNYTTEEYLPFSYVENGKLTGMAVEILRLVWKELGVEPQHIDVMPWARAYHNLKINPHNVLFATTRIKNREHLFKWACPIINAYYILLALKTSNISLSNTTSLNKYRVGTIRHDAGESILIEEFGQSVNIVSSVTMKPNLELMDLDRIDLIVYEKMATKSMLKNFKRDPDDYEIVYTLKDKETCFAFNIGIENELIGKFQAALTKVVATSKYSELKKKFFSEN